MSAACRSWCPPSTAALLPSNQLAPVLRGRGLLTCCIVSANKAAATHAAQHAKGGADPITPESIGAAPGGFGLGSEPSLFLDANDCVVNGWYRDANGNAKNVPWKYAHIFVTTYSAHIYIRQDAYITGGSASAPSVSHAVRIRHPDFLKENDFWGPWEYESGTPMYLGTEYRTTERYFGKPVYVKTVDFGALPNASYKFVGIENEASIIRVSALASNGKTLPGSIGASQREQVLCMGSSNSVEIITYADASSLTATVTAWYTKTVN